MNKHYIIGIDEAGRGAWAGPVVAGGFMIDRELFSHIHETINGIKDSKKLDRKKREDIFSTIEYLSHKSECQFTFAYRDADVIDSIWIREANRECMEDIILSLMQFIDSDDTVEIWIDGCDNYSFAVESFEYVFAKKKKRWPWWYTKSGESDGYPEEKQHTGGSGVKHCLSGDDNQIHDSFSSLSFPGLIAGNLSIPDSRLRHSGMTEISEVNWNKSMKKTHLWKEKNSISYLINGDDLHPIISLWSIVAKVVRDRIMCEYSEDFPLYRFHEHVGYGTKKHQEAMNNYNITSIHRKSYAPVKRLISTVSSI
jgi:ribonuclease HII